MTVYERAEAPGGLLRFGIPEFKLEKRHLDRRLDQMRAEGTRFACGIDAGRDVTAAQLRAEHDAVVLAGGATIPGACRCPARTWPESTRPWSTCPRRTGPSLAAREPPISAHGRHVVIIGGGDTGADCLGTAHRQGAASVTQLEIMPRPPDARPAAQPWPTYPMIYRVSSAHEEGGERVYAVSTQEFLGDDAGAGAGAAAGRGGRPGRPVRACSRYRTRAPGPTWSCSPWGSPGRNRAGLLDDLGVDMDARGNVARDAAYATSVPGVFVAGDMGRGQSLIVWAIAEGRSAAAAVDAYLMGSTALPAPIPPTARPLT